MKTVNTKNGLKMVALLLAGLLTIPVTADEGTGPFPAPAYVSLKQDNAVVAFPGSKVWEGGPTMLYDALTPDGKVLLVTSPSSGQVFAFDTATGKQLVVIKTTGKAPKGIKITPDGKEAWVSNEGGKSISVVDLGSYKVVATIGTDEKPHNVRFSSDGKTAYVTLQGGAGLGVIDTASRKVTKVIPIPDIVGPHNLDLSGDGKTAYVRDFVNSVAVLDLASGEVRKVIKVGNGHAGIDVLPDGSRVVTGAIGDTVVSVINPDTLEVVKKIEVGAGPHGVRASADSKWIYVTVTGANKIVVIDAETLEIAEEYPVGKFPFWAAIKGNP